MRIEKFDNIVQVFKELNHALQSNDEDLTRENVKQLISINKHLFFKGPNAAVVTCLKSLSARFSLSENALDRKYASKLNKIAEKMQNQDFLHQTDNELLSLIFSNLNRLSLKNTEQTNKRMYTSVEKYVSDNPQIIRNGLIERAIRNMIESFYQIQEAPTKSLFFTALIYTQFLHDPELAIGLALLEGDDYCRDRYLYGIAVDLASTHPDLAKSAVNLMTDEVKNEMLKEIDSHDKLNRFTWGPSLSTMNEDYMKRVFGNNANVDYTTTKMTPESMKKSNIHCAEQLAFISSLNVSAECKFIAFQYKFIAFQCTARAMIREVMTY